jgi:hypothetical protein
VITEIKESEEVANSRTTGYSEARKRANRESERRWQGSRYERMGGGNTRIYGKICAVCLLTAYARLDSGEVRILGHTTCFLAQQVLLDS